MHASTPATDAYGERPNETQPGAKPPVPKRNPDAVAYEVEFTFEDAPGPFAVMNAGMEYDVADERCLPRLGGMSGTRVQATQSIPIELSKISPTVYRGVFFDNLFLDEDYYGLGVCHWNFIGLGTGFRASGRAGETRFGEALFRHLRQWNMVLIPRTTPPSDAGEDPTHELVLFRHADANVLAQTLPALDPPCAARFFGPARAVSNA